MLAIARRANVIVAILLVLSAVLVAVGVGVESATGHVESSTEAGHDEAGEQAGGTGEHHDAAPTGSGVEEATIAGVSLESPLFVGGLMAASVGLAFVVWRRPSRPVAILVILFAIAAGIFDVAELSRQASRGSPLLALAVLIVVLRLLTIAATLPLLRRGPIESPPTSNRLPSRAA